MRYSQGEHFKIIPKNPLDNCQFREDTLQFAWHDTRLREAIWEMCRTDILFWLNAFVFTYDPRLPFKSIPFITWDFQDDAVLKILECIEDGKDLVIEKSRDMGASWMCLMVFMWLWWFHRGNSFLMISRKEDLVDGPGNMDALFPKMDFVLKYCPTWLRPNQGKAVTKWRRDSHLNNLELGSIIDGDSTTGKAGVGGRRTAMLIDEFSRIEKGELLLSGTADTTRCRIFNFTPFGSGNASHTLATRSDITKLRLHWSLDPRKNRGLYQWNLKKNKCEYFDKTYEFPPDYKFVADGVLRSPVYDAEDRRRANRKEMAEMWDIDYAGSAYQFFDQITIKQYQAEYACEPYWEGDIGSDGGLVKQPGGPIKLWCRLDHALKPAISTLGYSAGVDVSYGVGTTNSCCSIVDNDTGIKVCEYVTPWVRPEQFARNVVGLCRLFRGPAMGALLCWERQGPGDTFGKEVLLLGYRDVYYQKNHRGIPNVDPAWYPDDAAKRDLMERYRTAIAARRMMNHSKWALDETLLMIFKGGKIEHTGALDQRDPTGAGVNHGDRVVADALAWKLVLEANGGEFGKLRADAERQNAAHIGTLAGRKKMYDVIAQQQREGWVA